MSFMRVLRGYQEGGYGQEVFADPDGQEEGFRAVTGSSGILQGMWNYTSGDIEVCGWETALQSEF